jgi:3-oxoadipate enol-lactonase
VATVHQRGQPSAQTTRIGDVDIHYVDAGEGFPVLLIHGLAGDHSAWDVQIGKLAQRYRVIAPDNRGAGMSTRWEQPITVAQFGRDLLDLLQRLGIERCHVVGRSLGGMVGQEMALQDLGRVHTLVTMASAAKIDAMARRCAENMLEALLWRNSWEDHARHSIQYFVSDRFLNEQPERVAAIQKFIGSSDRAVASYAGTSLASREHDVLDRLSQIRCPTYVMAGGREPLCGPVATGWMLDRLPNARFELFENSSHFFFIEEAARFNERLEGWLAEHTPS